MNITTGHEMVDNSRMIQIAFICGVIDTHLLTRFERAVFRITRGKAILNNQNFPTELMNDLKFKNPDKFANDKSAVFIVFPLSGQSNIIGSKLINICRAFEMNIISVPKTKEEIYETISGYEQEIVDYVELSTQTKSLLLDKLQNLSRNKIDYKCSHVEQLRLSIVKERAVYSTLNLFNRIETLLVGTFWAPKKSAASILEAMDELKKTDPKFSGVSITPMTHNKQPPTYFETNDFTEPFQVIVNTYGIPKYKEINPAYVTIVTFCYQFGVMFGDIAHGACIFLGGLYLLMNKETLQASNVGRLIFKARYLLMLLGFFSFYCGFIYNDFMGIKLIVFGSCYYEQNNGSQIYYERDENCTYPIGFDWVWGGSGNDITFTNSFKMKLSIIVGVLHMTMGIIFKGK